MNDLQCSGITLASHADTRVQPVRLFTVVLMTVSTAITVGAAVQESDSAQLESVTLQLKWKHQFQFAGYYAAVKQGYYREVGLDVALREAGAGQDIQDTVLSGEADFGIATSDLVLRYAEGAPVVALAPIYQHSPLVFLVAASAHINNLHELAGKRVALEPHAAELLAYLKFEGVPQEELSFVTLDFDLDQLIDGKVDAISAYSTDELFVLKEAGVDYLVFNPRAGGIDFYGDTLFTSRGYLEQHPQRVKQFVEASLAGWRYALEHPEEIVDLILSDYSTRHTREHLLFEAAATQRLIQPNNVEIGYVNPGRWRYIASVYADLGMMQPLSSLDGFLYERSPGPSLKWLFTGWGITALVAIFVLGIALWFYRLHAIVSRQAETLQRALDDIRMLRGIIPVCSYCHKVRDDTGAWREMQRYIQDHSEAQFSHGICADCLIYVMPAEDAMKDERESGEGTAS